MKKHLSILAAGLLGVAVAGCGGSAAQVKVTTNVGAVQAAPKEKAPTKEDLSYREIVTRVFKYVDGINEEAQDKFGEGVLFLHQFPPAYARAQEAFKTAIQKDPTFPESYFNLGQLYERIGQPAKAIEIYEAAAAKTTNKLDARAYIGKVWLATAKKERDAGKLTEATQHEVKAKQIFDDIIAEDSENLGANNSLALYWLFKGDSKTAEDFVRKVLLKAPRDVVALNTRGLINLMAGELKIAKWVFEQKALKFDPNSIEALTNLGITYLKMGDTPMGVTSFEKALEIDPNNYEARMNVSAIYLNYLHYKAAQEQYIAALELVPDSVEAMIGLGSCYLGMQQPDKAVAVWDKALVAAPKTTVLYTRIAKLYETKLNNLDKAIEYYEKYLAVANPPDNDPIRGKLPVLKEMAKNGGMIMPPVIEEVPPPVETPKTEVVPPVEAAPAAVEAAPVVEKAPAVVETAPVVVETAPVVEEKAPEVVAPAPVEQPTQVPAIEEEVAPVVPEGVPIPAPAFIE
jgi:tetratricopeptide (TPR) repeat protein